LENLMIPCCFHPTRVLVIDDNKDFLDSLSRSLSSDHASYQYFKNPQKALHYLNEVYKANPFPDRYIESLDEEKWEHRQLDVNIFDTHHEVYRPERFEEISTVIVDHSMPGISGLQLCRQIKDPHIQKILLTGVADEHIAIHAFNEGIIHHYIRKQDLDMGEQLNQAVEASQWRYFNKLSEVAIKAITSADNTVQAIVDPHFQNFFKKLMKQGKFREVYLCESMGSYLLLTEEGAAHGLVVNNEDQLEMGADSGEALNVDPSILQQLKERKKMMCYHSSKGIFEPPAEEWKNHIYPTQTLQGMKETYYYAFLPNVFDIDLTRVVPFEKHKTGKGFEIEY
jgi:CheY-like chemotaxis protein